VVRIVLERSVEPFVVTWVWENEKKLIMAGEMNHTIGSHILESTMHCQIATHVDCGVRPMSIA
jgi:hypothetical protein